MANEHTSHGSDKPLLLAIIGVLALYGLAAAFGWPQKGAALIAEQSHHAATADQHPRADEHDRHGQEKGHSTDHSSHGNGTDHGHPPYWMITPFVLLLGAIAVLPLLPWTGHWWESNRNRFLVAAVLGVLTLLYYLTAHEKPVEAHWPAHDPAVSHDAEGLNWHVSWTVLANAVLHEYIPFIMLLFSLYTISGGIRIEGDLPAHPLTNTGFIAVGGVLASFVGTTGAAMLLIRPLLETNRERKHVVHTVVVFIFVVCNCGGCLLPIGDPPLFLGYLRGVPFLWTMGLWPAWLFVNGSLLAFYYIWDHFWYYPRETRRDIVRDEIRVRPLRFSGVWPNALLLVGVVFSVALLDPSKPLPGTDWHPWMYLREIAQLGLVALSLGLGSAAVRRANNFNYHAIIEVAALFFGIFICMQAPLQILNVRGAELGVTSPMQFFWFTGTLSSVLDNAPTYVVFFATAGNVEVVGDTLVPPGVAETLLIGVSLGAVFMGAMTYIGNGPNFMVKAIAEKSGVRMPSFFGYMIYSCCILLPLFIVTTLIFL